MHGPLQGPRGDGGTLLARAQQIGVGEQAEHRSARRLGHRVPPSVLARLEHKLRLERKRRGHHQRDLPIDRQPGPLRRDLRARRRPPPAGVHEITRPHQRFASMIDDGESVALAHRAAGAHAAPHFGAGGQRHSLQHLFESRAVDMPALAERMHQRRPIDQLARSPRRAHAAKRNRRRFLRAQLSEEQPHARPERLAGLPADGRALQHHHRAPAPRQERRHRQPGRSASDDRDVGRGDQLPMPGFRSCSANIPFCSTTKPYEAQYCTIRACVVRPCWLG